jgi:uncharacterized protein
VFFIFFRKTLWVLGNSEKIGGGKMATVQRQTALVTGASTGIGMELSRLFALNGYNLVLVARNEAVLKRLASEWREEYGVDTLAVAKDLSHHAAPDELVDWLDGKGIHVDVLVNNAGFGQYGPYLGLSPQQEMEMIQVNVASLTRLTRLLARKMAECGGGKILNVASVAAFQPGPLMAVYYATKAYVLSYSEALSEELADQGIQVSVLCPGPTRTEFFKRAGMVPNAWLNRFSLSAREVALEGYRGLMEGKTLIIPGFRNRLMVWLNRLLPRKAVVRTVRKMQEKRVK